MKRTVFLFFVILSLVAAAEDPFELVPSSAEEIASLFTYSDSLIGGLLNPLSGQLSLRSTDFSVKGAQTLTFNRVYIPPNVSLPYAHGEMEQYLEEKKFFSYLQQHYKGWVFTPQIYLQRENAFQTRLTDGNGAVVLFQHNGDGSNAKPLSLYGMSNDSHGTPQGSHDLRNVRFSFGNEIKVFFPDGYIRIYQPAGNVYVLDKEILPS